MTAQRIVLSIAMAVALTLAVHAQVKERAEVALQAAIKQELVNGDLAGAIKQYEAIVSTYGKTNRPVAAQALLHMAEAYQKLGSAEARKVYEQIINEYGDQTAAVSQARANLRSAGETGLQVSGPRMLRRLDGEATENSLSPDGQTLAMYRLSLLDLATGKTNRLNPNFSGTPEELKRTGRYEDAEWPVLTRDSKQVAYEWYVWDGTKWSSQLRVMSTDADARPRTLVNNPEFDYFVPIGWATDARSVLTEIDRGDGTRVLAWVSTADGVVTVVESLGWRLYGRPSLSPDGRYIAYSALATAPDRRISKDAAKLLERHIYVLASDGSSRAELTLTTGVVDQSPVWSPDSSTLVFPSNRSGTFGLWSVPVKDGKAAGPVSLLRGNTGEVELLGVTGTGTLYYANYAEARTVSVVSVTRGGATASRVTDVLSGSTVSWSPDGKTVAVGRPAGDGGLVPALVLHSVGTGAERSYLHDGLLPRVAPRWFPDGKRLLVAVADRPEDVDRHNSQSAWFSLDRQSGSWTKVLAADPERGYVYMGPDDKAIYYIDGSTTPDTVMKLDLATGSKTKVFDFGILPKGEHGIGNLSPDGRMWAIRSSIGADTYVFIVDLERGGYHELYHGPAGSNIVTGLQWSGDSRMIVWGEQQEAKEGAPRRLRVMQIAASGGPVQFSGIELDGSDNGYPNMSPDGSHVALTTYRRDSELWTLDLSSLMKMSPK